MQRAYAFQMWITCTVPGNVSLGEFINEADEGEILEDLQRGVDNLVERILDKGDHSHVGTTVTHVRTRRKYLGYGYSEDEQAWVTTIKYKATCLLKPGPYPRNF